MSAINKTQALARLTALETEAKQLRLVLEAPDSLLDPAEEKQVAIYGHFPATAAYAYSEALCTFIELRKQPGTCSLRPPSATHVVMHYFVEPYFNSDNRWVIHVMKYIGTTTKLARISPSFTSWHDAEKAITNLGEARLLQMFYTLHGFTPK